MNEPTNNVLELTEKILKKHSFYSIKSPIDDDNEYHIKINDQLYCVMNVIDNPKDIETVQSICKDTMKSVDEKYKAVKEWTKLQDFVSISIIQRKCSLGYILAKKFLEDMQAEGIVSHNPINSKLGYKVIERMGLYEKSLLGSYSFNSFYFYYLIPEGRNLGDSYIKLLKRRLMYITEDLVFINKIDNRLNIYIYVSKMVLNFASSLDKALRAITTDDLL